MSSYTDDWPEAVSFRLSLEATKRSVRTVETYMEAVRAPHAFLAGEGGVPSVQQVTATDLRGFLRRPAGPEFERDGASAPGRYFEVLVTEDEIVKNPMSRVEAPRVVAKE